MSIKAPLDTMLLSRVLCREAAASCKPVHASCAAITDDVAVIQEQIAEVAAFMIVNLPRLSQEAYSQGKMSLTVGDAASSALAEWTLTALADLT